MLRSNDAVLEFETMRFQLAKAAGRQSQTELLDRMEALAKVELARTQDSLETARRDSRLGYEWEEDYIYRPFTLEQKIKLLRQTIDREIPEYRRSGAVKQ